MTLNELFASCAEGMMVLAIDRKASRLVSIDEVASGYACGCDCPSCARPVVARKGEVRKHSFAHHFESDRSNCQFQAESTLHRFAKELLEQHRWIRTPDIAVTDELGPLVIANAKRVDFDDVVCERREGELVPDVAAKLGTRRLHIEFKVTHGCPPAKLDKLRRMDVSVLEVDLSEYRDVPLVELEEIVLDRAPRIMLVSPIFAKGPARLEQRIADTAATLVETMKAYRPLRVRREKFSGKLTKTLESPYVMSAIDGMPLFEIADIEWQSWIVHTLITRHDSPVSLAEFTGQFRASGWVGEHEDDLKTTVARYARERLEFRIETLEETVERFLLHLERLGLAERFDGNRWLGRNLTGFEKTRRTNTARHKQLAALARTNLFQTRRSELFAVARAVVEKTGVDPARFDGERWLLAMSRSFGMNPFHLVNETTLLEELVWTEKAVGRRPLPEGWPDFGLTVTSSRGAGDY
jgi:hypothetical protein